jgi:hypothetical protein
MAESLAVAAVRAGLLSLGEVWSDQGRRPGEGLCVAPTRDGAVIHRSGRPVPEVVPLAATSCTRGRTLHIGPGVALTDVGEFVASLPPDLRPANYTVSPAAGHAVDRQLG